MNIGQKLKEARTQAGLSQEKVSEKIHVSRQTISNWETEKTYPDVVSIVKLSDLYGISLDELLKGNSKMLQYLDESTNTVKSNRRLSIIGIVNLVVILAVLLFIGDHGSILLWITMIGEFILLCAADFSYARGVNRPPSSCKPSVDDPVYIDLSRDYCLVRHCSSGRIPVREYYNWCQTARHSYFGGGVCLCAIYPQIPPVAGKTRTGIKQKFRST